MTSTPASPAEPPSALSRAALARMYRAFLPGLVSATALLALALPQVATEVPDAGGSLPLRLTLALDDGGCTVVERSVEQHGPSGWPRVDHVRAAWLEAEGLPPVPVDLDRPTPTAPPKNLDAGTLTVRLQRPRAVRPAAWRQILDDGVAVVAAPVTMWERVPESCLPVWEAPLPPVEPAAETEWEDSLLHLPVFPGEPWRVRIVAEGWGTWWMDVAASGVRQRSVTLTPEPAAGVVIEVLGATGEPVSPAWVVFRSTTTTGEPGNALARFDTDERGTVAIPALPAGRQIVAALGSPRHPPVAEQWDTSAPPASVRLPAGSSLAGRLLTPRGEPVIGAPVEARGWASPRMPFSLARFATTDEEGRFTLDALPRGETVMVQAAATGFVPVRRSLKLDAPRVDLAPWTLEPGVDVEVTVVNHEGRPIVGAELWRDRERLATTEEGGSTVLEAQPVGRPLELLARADGYRSNKVTTEITEDRRLTLQLSPAFRVVGTVETGTGEPVSQGRLEIRQGNGVRLHELEADGSFEVDLPPGEPAVLAFSSPATRELLLDVASGRPGERRDLGVVRLLEGMTVRGRLVRAEDGTPVTGARVWAPRTTEGGETFAWFREDLLQATSDSEGLFELSGAAVGPLLLRVESPRRARRHLAVEPPGEGNVVELGEVTLEEGATVEVRLPEDTTRGKADRTLVARLDLRGQWREADMLTATVRDEAAAFHHVPTGTALVTVMAGRELLCEETVGIAPGTEEQEVWCEPDDDGVRGWVRVGGQEPGPGRLHWQLRQEHLPAAVIHHEDGPLGLGKTRVLGAGRPDQTLEVAADGRFEGSLGAGTWTVTWTPEEGAATAPKQVELRDDPAAELILDFPADRLRGIVVDSDGEPVAGARVREHSHHGFTFSGGDGHFELSGLPAGEPLRVRASLGAARSSLATVTLQAGVEPDPLELVLDEDEAEPLRLRVLNAEGAPVAGAFVFLESDNGPLRMATTRADGAARMETPEPPPRQVRLAAWAGGIWSLGPWRSFEEVAGEGMTASLPAEPGILEVTSEEYAGTVPITLQDGWDLSGLMLRLGHTSRVAPGEPLRLPGLPPTAVHVGSLEGGAPRQTRIPPGELVTVKLR